MTSPQPPYLGIWLPLVSPFRDGRLDEASFRRLVGRYGGHVDGFVLAATTGEGFALSLDETRRLVEWTAEVLSEKGQATPVVVGVGGASTASVVDTIALMAAWPVSGFLVACPHYVRPSQEGLRLHFEAVADASARDLLIYNIPYRTAVNLENETLLRLAERTKVVGVKDCCADAGQSQDLILRKPPGFSVLTGEDAVLLSALKQGADGAILASAHLDPQGFRKLHGHVRRRQWSEAEAIWRDLVEIPPHLFAEPNPSALKHCLWRAGLIDSPEVRLPLVPVSPRLARRLERLSCLDSFRAGAGGPADEAVH